MPSNELIIVLLLLAAIGLILCGNSRLTAIRRGSNDNREKWLPGLALGIGAVILVSLLFFYLNGLYRLGQLDSAIATVRDLIVAETRFAKVHPEQGYTCNLSELSTDGRTIEQPGMLARAGQRNDYSFEIRGCQKIDGEPNPTYEIIARPLREGDPHGGENVCADQSGVVRFYDARCDQK